MSTTSQRITAALITRNEQPRLLRLLPRLDWVDEIVVVDSGSTDGTLELALHYGCRVMQHPLDDFAAQRNRALSMATGDWILSIDADELPRPGLAPAVRSAISATDVAGYRLPIRSTIFGHPFRYSGTQDDRPVRLFRRDAARWHGAVHEVLQVHGSVAELPLGLEHYTIPTLDVFLAKMNRYTQLDVQAKLAAGHAPRAMEPYLAPVRETLRRLIWKRGILDGPPGWAFCALSGLSAWVVADRHRRQWRQSNSTVAISHSLPERTNLTVRAGAGPCL